MWKAFPAYENHLHDPVECLFLFFIHFFLSKPCRRLQKASLSFSIFHFCLFLLVKTIFLYIESIFLKIFEIIFTNQLNEFFPASFSSIFSIFSSKWKPLPFFFYIFLLVESFFYNPIEYFFFGFHPFLLVKTGFLSSGIFFVIFVCSC